MSNPLANSQSGKIELTRRSIVVLFSVGALMLVIPVGVVLSENSICRANPSSCIHSDAYRYLGLRISVHNDYRGPADWIQYEEDFRFDKFGKSCRRK